MALFCSLATLGATTISSHLAFQKQRLCYKNSLFLGNSCKTFYSIDEDPKTHPDAKRFDHISYLEVINRHLHVMDTTAISLCMDNNIPMIVFNLGVKGNIKRALQGEDVGTVITAE